jgi:DNA-binding NtrC family response regulator
MEGTRVLLVDDEESLRITLAANLELEGYEVVEAGSGEEALELAESQAFDLVLSDIKMPGMNGVDLFRALKRKWPEVPCILMSAFALEDLVASALSEGVFTLLPKPFDIQSALAVLTRAARGPVVLVVDDTRSDADTMAGLFEAVGLKARAVLSGEEALEAIAGGDVDVCVVDLVMPGMSGAELIEEFRSERPDVPVIAISGHDVGALLRSTETKVFTSFHKPVPPDELIRAVAQARSPGKV